MHRFATEINEGQQHFHLREIALHLFDVIEQSVAFRLMRFFYLSNVLLSLRGLTFEGFNLLFQRFVLLFESLGFVAAKN